MILRDFDSNNKKILLCSKMSIWERRKLGWHPTSDGSLFLLMRRCSKRNAAQRQTCAALRVHFWPLKNSAWWVGSCFFFFYFSMFFKVSLLKLKLSHCTCTDRALRATKISYFSNLDPEDMLLAFTVMYTSAPSSRHWTDTYHVRSVDKVPGRYSSSYTYTVIPLSK